MTLTVYRYSMHHFLLQQHWGAVSSLFCWTHHVHTRQCSHGQRSCDCQPHFNSSDLRSHSKTKSRMSVRAAVTRRFRASKCASVALSGGEKKLQGCLSILTAWRLVSSKTKEEVGEPRWKPSLLWTGLGNHMASLLLHSLQQTRVLSLALCSRQRESDSIFWKEKTPKNYNILQNLYDVQKILAILNIY